MLPRTTLFSVYTFLAIFVAITFIPTDVAHGQDRDTEIQKHWLEVSSQYAKDMQVRSQSKLKVLEQPIFRHTQSVRGDDIGAIHLWLDEDNRPALIGSIFAWTKSDTHRMVSIEFHSLMDQGDITLSHSERQLWNNSLPGITWKSFPPSMIPQSTGSTSSMTQARRKLLARQLSRSFGAETKTPQDKEWKLRFIPTPIYEYTSNKMKIVYGSIFAFCQGTDSEVLVLIEANEQSGTITSWRYSLVPFTDYDAVVTLNGENIWRSPKGQMNEDGKPHFWTLLEESKKPDVEMQTDAPK